MIKKAGFLTLDRILTALVVQVLTAFFENASICNLPKSLYTSNYIARPNRLATSDLGLPIVRVRGSKGLENGHSSRTMESRLSFLTRLMQTHDSK